MCYHSQRLRRDEFRNVKTGEDLTMHADGMGHHYPIGQDGKVVCILDQTEVHIAAFTISPDRRRDFYGYTGFSRLRELEGKPVTARMCERHSAGYSYDALMINGCEVHFIYLAPGTKFYTGPKRVELADTLGVNDPSIVHDHKPVDQLPTEDRVLRVREYASITK